jgi:hypothetical protein
MMSKEGSLDMADDASAAKRQAASPITEIN